MRVSYSSALFMNTIMMKKSKPNKENVKSKQSHKSIPVKKKKKQLQIQWYKTNQIKFVSFVRLFVKMDFHEQQQYTNTNESEPSKQNV